MILPDGNIQMTVEGGTAGFTFSIGHGPSLSAADTELFREQTEEQSPVADHALFIGDKYNNLFESGIEYWLYATHPIREPEGRLVRVYFNEAGGVVPLSPGESPASVTLPGTPGLTEIPTLQEVTGAGNLTDRPIRTGGYGRPAFTPTPNFKGFAVIYQGAPGETEYIELATKEVVGAELAQYLGFVPDSDAPPALTFAHYSEVLSSSIAVVNTVVSQGNRAEIGFLPEANCSFGDAFQTRLLGLNGTVSPNNFWQNAERYAGNFDNGSWRLFGYGVLPVGSYRTEWRAQGVTDPARIKGVDFVIMAESTASMPTGNRRVTGKDTMPEGGAVQLYILEIEVRTGQTLSWQKYSGSIIWVLENAPAGIGIAGGELSAGASTVTINTPVIVRAHAEGINTDKTVTILNATPGSVNFVTHAYNEYGLQALVNAGIRNQVRVDRLSGGSWSNSGWFETSLLPGSDAPPATGSYNRSYGIIEAGQYKITARPFENADSATWKEDTFTIESIQRRISGPAQINESNGAQYFLEQLVNGAYQRVDVSRTWRLAENTPAGITIDGSGFVYANQNSVSANTLITLIASSAGSADCTFQITVINQNPVVSYQLTGDTNLSEGSSQTYEIRDASGNTYFGNRSARLGSGTPSGISVQLSGSLIIVNASAGSISQDTTIVLFATPEGQPELSLFITVRNQGSPPPAVNYRIVGNDQIAEGQGGVYQIVNSDTGSAYFGSRTARLGSGSPAGVGVQVSGSDLIVNVAAGSISQDTVITLLATPENSPEISFYITLKNADPAAATDRILRIDHAYTGNPVSQFSVSNSFYIKTLLAVDVVQIAIEYPAQNGISAQTKTEYLSAQAITADAQGYQFYGSFTASGSGAIHVATVYIRLRNKTDSEIIIQLNHGSAPVPRTNRYATT